MNGGIHRSPLRLRHLAPAIIAAACAAAFASGCATTAKKPGVKWLEEAIAEKEKHNAVACMEGCIAFTGDSNIEITQWHRYYKKRNACNLAIRGYTTEQVYRDRDKVRALKPGAIVVQCGGNDLRHRVNIQTINRNHIKIMEYYKEICQDVYFLSLLPVVNNEYISNATIRELNAMLEKACKERKVRFVDVFTPLYNPARGLDTPYALDLVHVNRTGQDRVGAILRKHLRD